MNEAPQGSESTSNIVGEALAFMKGPDEHPIPFDEIMAMIRDVSRADKLFEVMSQVLNDSTIKDGRKFMMVQIIGFGYSSKFTIEQYNALTLLLGYFARKTEKPTSTSGEKVVHLWDTRIITSKVRAMASAITKESERMIAKVDAQRVFASPPFSLDVDVLTTIIDEVYPQSFN